MKTFLRVSCLKPTLVQDDFVPVERKPVYACYDNKKIRNWTADDFAEYIFDNTGHVGTWIDRGPKNEFLHNWRAIVEYLRKLPPFEYDEQFPRRVYLYGVWLVWKDSLKSDKA